MPFLCPTTYYYLSDSSVDVFSHHVGELNLTETGVCPSKEPNATSTFELSTRPLDGRCPNPGVKDENTQILDDVRNNTKLHAFWF